MRALVITAPGRAEVQEVAAPTASAGEVVVDVQRAGICGTDIEFFTGEMQYLHSGHAAFPMRIGHEWMGTVSAVGEGVDGGWLGTRVTGDTMLGCGQCRRCLAGRQHVCAFRTELGIRGGRPGALAEQVAVPATSLHRLPDAVDDAAGAMVEPGGNARRAVDAAELSPGDRVLVLGPGTIGLLCALFARAVGAEVHLVGRSARSLAFGRELGFSDGWTEDELPELPWDAVIEASHAPHLPAKAAHLVEPGGRVVYIGLSGTPSLLDTRDLVLADVTAVGILSASPGLAGAIDAYASGSVDPRPLVAATVDLAQLPAILAGERPPGAGPGPKFHVAI
ncbi:zinc-binding dehydrogenase [Microbacterium sp. SS28]|uniref:zinc-dependent alcohol dehydrogenase n=1 Tax=Microbacterium sp. SS28 TaxID=2919948 RepID=UPI001FAB2205|nr:alcohol dehydrogenase catalytic domain-containing protein [Microbacterium sp. SS28]